MTGIVQEFQFGMNWSAYSRFVGDIFGAPLAIEGLAAFFLESTFIGLWIFGWDRLSPRLHAATMWVVAFGTCISAFFILAANAWMQHPVGYELNPETDRAELIDFFALMTNITAWSHFRHTMAALATGGMFLIGERVAPAPEAGLPDLPALDDRGAHRVAVHEPRRRVQRPLPGAAGR